MSSLTATVSARSPGVPPVSRALLEGRSVGFRYEATTVLTSVDISVGRGEAVAVVGRSGSGKSTLLHCLAGLIRPTSGDVLLDGEPLPAPGSEASAQIRRRRLGFVFQNGLLVADLTVLENVALPLLLDGRPRGEALARAQHELAGLGLAELGGRFPGALSGGEAQRAAIARALVIEPDVVFADEPTGALDTGNAGSVLDLLLHGARHRGAALLLVTHDTDLAARTDRVLRVTDGRVMGVSGEL